MKEEKYEGQAMSQETAESGVKYMDSERLIEELYGARYCEKSGFASLIILSDTKGNVYVKRHGDNLRTKLLLDNAFRIYPRLWVSITAAVKAYHETMDSPIIGGMPDEWDALDKGLVSFESEAYGVNARHVEEWDDNNFLSVSDF